MFRLIIGPLVLALASGCSSVMSSATAHLATSFSQALLNQNDPETVRDGIPAYLLMIDGFIEAEPEDTNNLLAGARLYATFASTFVKNEERSQRLSDKSLAYAKRALCIENELLCSVYDQPHTVFLAALSELDIDDIPVTYAFASAWAGWIQANKGDWNAIADLPKITALLERVVALQEDYKEGEPLIYLAVLATQLPPSLGGKPEQGRKYFERAIALSHGHNLMAKVLYARQYARLLYNRVLHDEILNEVLLAKTDYPGLTLANTLAKRQAKELLSGADDYF